MQFLDGSYVCSMKYSIEKGPGQMRYFAQTCCLPLRDRFFR